MKEFNLGILPTAIDITIYKYNYLDNKLWTQIQNECEFIDLGKESIMISVNEIGDILNKYYIDDVNKIKSVGSDLFHKEVTTIFFLYQMLIEMPNLKYIKINLNKNKAYSRLVTSDGANILKFDFKTLSATLKLYDVYPPEELGIVNKYLKKAGVLKNHYVRIRANELATKIDDYLADNPDDKDAGIMMDIVDIIEPKLEKDGALTLLNTDY